MFQCVERSQTYYTLKADLQPTSRQLAHFYTTPTAFEHRHEPLFKLQLVGEFQKPLKSTERSVLSADLPSFLD